MFTVEHLIWLGAVAALIAVALVIVRHFNISDRVVGKAVMIALIVLKLFHIALSMEPSEHGGYILVQTQLSFHLCSIMIYVTVLVNMISNKKVIDTLKSFMVPALFIGALMALLVPTEGTDPAVARVWQYMIIHGVLVFYGIYLAVFERVDLSFRAYLNNLKLLCGVTLLGFFANSVLEAYGTNFLFLRLPPMENLPLLNLDNGWYVYFLTLAAVACILMLLVHLPFIALSARRAKREGLAPKA